MPMVILSGFAFPIENMPPVIQAVTYLFPLRYYFVIIRGLFLKGVSLGELWREAAALLAIGTVIITASVLRFRIGSGRWDDTDGSVWNRVVDGTGRKDAFFAVYVEEEEVGWGQPGNNAKIINLVAA